MKNTWIIIGIAVVIIAGIFIFKSKTDAPVLQDSTNEEVIGDTASAPTAATTGDATVPASSATGTSAGGTPTTTAKTFTLAQVAVHNNQTSCYSAINGVVYDLTSWISRHPGGAQEILGICGKDGSSAFNGQHGTQGRPASILAGFEIGTLTK